MGSSQSTPASTPLDQHVIQQLRTLHMRDNAGSQDVGQDYIHVEKDGSGQLYLNGPSLSNDAAEQWEKELLADPKNRLALNALLSNPLEGIVTQKIATLSDQQTYNITIPFEGAPVTNQRSSGRCWLFATTNVLRVAVMKKHNLKEFELSQAYLFFWDKLEKANYFFTQIIDTVDQELESREVQELLGAPVNDGGQWDMASNLVQKYGIVPQKLYPDSYNAMASGSMDRIITTKLREDALRLRALAGSEKSKDKLQDAKARMLREVHTIITLMLGPPPKPDQKFTWEYVDANGKYHSVSKTPLDLVQELSTPSAIRTLNANISEMFSLVNDPRHDYLTHLSVARLGNVIEGRPISYVNVDMTTMKKAAISMLKAGLPVWFGCDVGKFSNSTSGVMDTKLYDYNLAFNIKLGMTKAQRLRVRESAMTHAMVLTAVQVENGKSVRWRVQNSWGATAGEKGFFVMSDDWMDQFTYQVVVDPGHVAKEVRDVVKSDPIVLPLWDPLGALA